MAVIKKRLSSKPNILKRGLNLKQKGLNLIVKKE